MSSITILAFFDRVSLYHTLTPFYNSKYKKMFYITDNVKYCLKNDKNKILIMVRQFLKPDVVDFDLLKKIRDKYEKIVFFNGNAGGGIPRLDILPYVDLFYNKALYKDRNLYKLEHYGDELFTQYYHEKYRINDTPTRKRPILENDDDLKKLRVSWNIGIGEYPRHKFKQRVGVFSSRYISSSLAPFFYNRKNYIFAIKEKTLGIHARLGFASRDTIAFQRHLFLEKIKNHKDFMTGFVSQKQFNKEIIKSKIIFSPFGWGELCLRDFEAILVKALLLKPDMSHLETWPDIFRDKETYIALKWDGSDFLTKAEHYLKDNKARNRIVDHSYNNYMSYINKIDQRFESVISEIIN
ncbi:hypothetical protein [Spirochaeta cellobiosiphila]|uniref:hypothetical protein n=1 Tax=Spirochaeta cellobiosiphila TaxID=504483 RepID=UPI000423F000|nr:hypothetical protein [Spirochaeta cellobiosiphila]